MIDSTDINPLYSLVFVIDFCDGYSLRSLFEYMKLTKNEVNVILSSNKIQFQQFNQNQGVFNHVEINSNDLTNYQYTSPYEYTLFMLGVSEILGVIKSVGKKDGIRLSKSSGRLDLELVVFNNNTTDNIDRTNISLIRLQNPIDSTIYEQPHYTLPDSQPSFTIQSNMLSKVTRGISSVRSGEIILYGYPKGLKINCNFPDITMSKICILGKIEDVVQRTSNNRVELVSKIISGPLVEIKIRPYTIKNLHKIITTNSLSMVKFYIEKDMPIKILTSIGNFGKISVIINNAGDM
jgi:hypothetical protein